MSTASTTTSNPLPTLYCYDISGSNDRGGYEAAPEPRCAKARMLKPFSNQTIDRAVQPRFSYIYGMLYCSSECGSISIIQLGTIYCNTHAHTFHVCLCLLALTFVCNSTYLLKCSFQIYQKSIVVFIRSSKVSFKTTSCAKGPVTWCNFLGNLQRNSALKRCKLVFV